MGKTFGKALQEIRELKGCSRTDLARQIEIRAEGIKKYEDEQVNITVKKAVEVANALKCGFGWNGNEFWFSQHKSKKKKRKKEIGIYDYWFD